MEVRYSFRRQVVVEFVEDRQEAILELFRARIFLQVFATIVHYLDICLLSLKMKNVQQTLSVCH